jgi:outer membrane lipopolysaccharide assembly protein LptE/RlpB
VTRIPDHSAPERLESPFPSARTARPNPNFSLPGGEDRLGGQEQIISRFGLFIICRRSLTALVLAGSLLAGCGYSFQSQPRLVAVPTFSNKTFRPGLEIRARDLVLQRLSERNISVTAEEEAELTLKGSILAYSIEAVAFDARDISRQYRVNITARFSVQGRKGTEPFWEEVFSASSYYYTGPNVAATEMAEKRASDQAMEEISRSVVLRLMEIR